MKPRSVVGPLILIGIGTIFLLRNMWPDVPMFDLFARYWPFLLILWGVVRLVEVLFWAVSSRPLPVSGVSGGEWTLVVLLCILGATVFWGMNYASHWPTGRITMKGLEVFGEPFEFPVSAQKPVGRNPRIVLELGRGNAKIVGTDTDTIKITGRKTIRAFQQSDAEKGDKETPLEVLPMGDQVIIRTNQDRLDGSRRASSDLEIAAPKGASFEGRGRYGDFDISDLAGAVEINSDNAGVRVQNLAGSLKADLRRSDVVRAVNVKGAVEIKGRGQDIELDNVEGPVTVNGSYSGELSFRNLGKPLRFESSQTELRVERTAGFVRIALGNITGENVQGPIRLSTRSRDVQFRDFSNSLEVTVERGDVELRPAKQQAGKIDVRTKNGDINLALPGGARFELTATTRRGEVTNDYGAPLKAESEGRGATLRGSAGAGPAITLNTDRGSVTVRRADGSPEPPRSILPKSLTPEPPKAPPVPAPVRQ